MTAGPVRPERPLPEPRGEERRYFADLLERRLPYYRCPECEVVAAVPFVRCWRCGSPEEPEREWSAGEGVVHSFTVQERPGHPWFEGRTPCTVVLVDLAEQFRSLAHLRLPPEREPRIGAAVRVGFENAGEFVLPYFSGLDESR